ncbi:unnamed protein product, partial [Cylicostephanus goldi]
MLLFQAVENLLNALAKHESGATARSLAQSVQTLFPMVPNISDSIGCVAIPPAKWLLHLIPRVPDAVLPEIISALGNLSFYCCASPKASKILKRKLMLACRNKELAKRICYGINEVSKDASSAKKITCLMSMLSVVCDGLDHALFLDVFSKSVLLPKVRAEQFVIDSCKEALGQISESTFSDTLLPNMKKSLLRSPEVAIFGVVKILESATFPLDKYSNDLIKGLGALLGSSSDELRDAAIDGIVAIANLAEAPVVEKIVNYLLEQLSAAKTSEQRVAFLDGVAKCAKAKNANPDALEKIAANIVSKLTVPDKEAHENVVAAQWKASTIWARRLNNNSPALVSAFKNAPQLPIPVRHIGYRSLANIFTSRDMKSLPAEAEKQLWQELDNSAKEPLQFISLASLLLKSCESGTPNHTKVWSKVTKYDSILKDKPLGSICADDAIAWIDLLEKSILERPFSDTPGSYPPFLLKTLTLLMFWPDWQVRRRASLAVERILVIEESYFAETLADVIFLETISGFIDQTLRKVRSSHPDPSTFTVPGEWYVQAVRLLLTPKGPELEKLAIHTLLLASLPRLVEVDGSVWLRWVHSQADSSRWKESDVFRKTAIDRVLQCPD